MPLPRLLAVLTAAVTLAGCAATRPADPLPEEIPTPVVETTVVEETETAEAEEEASVADAALLPGAAPREWLMLDKTDDNVRGISADRGYRALAGRSPQRTVVVAVIDSGIDTTHADLRGRIWTNTDEVAGNGVDDDGNGYVDDRHGWSFLGNADGENIQYDTYEVTREVVRLRPLYQDADPAAFTEEQLEEYAYYQRAEEKLAAQQEEYTGLLAQMQMVEQATEQAVTILRPTLGEGPYAPEKLQPGIIDSEEVQRAKGLLNYLASNGLTPDDVTQQRKQIANVLAYGYNTDYDPRPTIGDDPADLTERSYGNGDVHGPYPGHGTSVAGVIAAVRGNGVGTDGVADSSVLIMPVRAVPNGDERDKDIANAIRYAVDNGALVVNMSFGKSYSPQKAVVDEAVRYAEERGVLLVHAAGNGSKNLDAADNFPTAALDDGTRVSNWLEVGATTWSADPFAATFTNYGQTSVDLFAPGAEIDVLSPGDAVDRSDGTSVAAPVVSGIAALLLSYYPDLSPLDVRGILLDSAVSYEGTTALRPGSDERVDFGTLSATGGVVNLGRAVELANARSGS
ncbi:MAG: S8 family peptidase [Bacteroidota bacterium]